MEEHLEKECPVVEIKCPFIIVGCTFEVSQLFPLSSEARYAPRLNANETYDLYNKHHKVFSLIKGQLTTHKPYKI